MKKCRAKKCSKHPDEIDDCVMFERDPNKFVEAEAEASGANKLACDAKRSAKKKIVRNQDDTTPVNIENMMKKWGDWYTFGKNENGLYTATCKACSSWYVGINKKELSDGTPIREYSKAYPIRHGKQKLG